jgi:HAD superfamily hydrolase (TIGR01549 family)
MNDSAAPAPGACLLFDYGGTLDSDGVAWKDRFRAIYRAEGVALPDEAFDRLFYDADDALIGTLEVEADLDETVRRLVANIERGMARYGEDPARQSRVAAAFLEASHATLRRNRPILEALRARYRMAIVSNFYGNLAAVCRGVGFAPLFDAVVDSERVGVGKPEAAIFHAAMEPLGARPEATFMIGDSLRRDGEGAARCGLAFIWIAPVEAHAGAGDAQRAIARLDELAELLL